MGAHGTDDVRIPRPAGGSLWAALATPDPPEPDRPGVIVLHEIWGLNDDIRRIAARFAENGYVTIAPDLFSEGNKALCLSRTMLDGTFQEGKRTLGSLEAVRAWLADRPEVDGTRIGVIGFCMGGGFALLFATRGSVGAASVNYGQVPKNRAKLTGVCPVVASYGAKDKVFAPQGRRLEQHLTEVGVPHDVEIYDGVGHSFWNKDAAPTWMTSLPLPMGVGYGEEQAEDAWSRTLTFFAEHLSSEHLSS